MNDIMVDKKYKITELLDSLEDLKVDNILKAVIDRVEVAGEDIISYIYVESNQRDNRMVLSKGLVDFDITRQPEGIIEQYKAKFNIQGEISIDNGLDLTTLYIQLTAHFDGERALSDLE